jgi:hypothetical protein
MRRSILNSVIQMHMPFQPLVQISSLCNVDRDPGSIFGLPGVDVISGQGLEIRIQRIDLVGVLLPRLPRPVDEGRRRTLRLPVMTK